MRMRGIDEESRCAVVANSMTLWFSKPYVEDMTPQKIRERLAETEGRVDPDEYVRALWYVRGDGQSR